MNVADHVAKAIEAATIQIDPWPHLQVRDVFPKEFYAEILKNFPQTDAMEPLGTSTPNRFLYWLERDGVRVENLPTFWEEMQEFLRIYVSWVLAEKLDVHSAYTGSELLYDLPGYSIGPHTDTPDKLVTGLFYLPETSKDARQGTMLLHCDLPDPRGKGHKWSDAFKPAKLIPYEPNTALFFARTDVSFHAVQRTPVTRKLLAFDLFRARG